MRRPLILTLAALLGLLLVWLIVVRPVQAPSAAASPAKTAMPAPPPAESVTPPPPPASVVATSVDAPIAMTESKAPPAPAESPTTPEPPADHAAESGDESVSTSDDTADEGTDETDDGPGAIDTDHATDLLADILARRDATDDSNGLPNASVQTLKKFNQDGDDADWSQKAEQQIEATLAAWLAALPGDVQDHVALIHVECHATMCQILAADNDADSRTQRADAGHEWQQAISSLPQQPWWHELGFVDLNTEVDSTVEGYALYMSYLLRGTAPPPGDVESPDVEAPDGGVTDDGASGGG
jgi:hypothetical protein